MKSLLPRLYSRHDPLFITSALVLTLACLWPIWYFRFLPMQDYPQHLFLAQVIATYDAPGFNWDQYYDVNLRVGPYSLEYWFMRAVGVVASIETSGKLFFSLYVLLMGLLVLRAARRFPNEHTPWALLLVFPLVFNQTYFLGFQNYLLSIPLLFLALLELDDFAAKPVTGASASRQGALLLALFLCHPFTTMVFVALAMSSALVSRHDGDRVRRMAFAIGATATLLGIWSATQGGLSPLPQQTEWQIWWWNFEGLWEFFAMMFTGMRINGGVDIVVTSLWIALGAAIAVSAIRVPSRTILRSRALVWCVLAILGYFVLPYWFGYYSYFNLRLAPVAMLAFVLFCSEISIRRGTGYMVAALCSVLVMFSIQIHGKIARETEEILPLLNQMEPNALVLPMYLKSNTDVLDPTYFNELHLHDHNYYHVLVGGGANPFLFPNPMLPVQYRAGVRLPAPSLKARDVSFNWQDVHRRYRYILTRGDGAELLMRYLAQSTRVVAQSGSWSLFENYPLSVD